ncbi:MAG: CTP synthetase, partial [Nitrosopumilus sp.]
SRRHRHRFEFNKEYLDIFEKNGMMFSGESDGGKRMEILEIPDHKFFLGIQFHPEFSSRPGFPEESFEAFMSASAQN